MALGGYRSMNHQGNLSVQTPEAHTLAPMPMMHNSPVGSLSVQHLK